MAFYDEEEDELNQQDPNAQGGVATSGESGVISGQSGSGGSGAGNSPLSPDKPSNFVGIKEYLDANKTQAGKLGDQTAQVINTSADEARQGVGALNSAADNSIKATNSLGAGILGKISTGAEALSGDERNQVKQTASAKYTGPKTEADLGDAYTNAAKTTQTATNNINNSGTEEGRMNLISQVNSKPRTQGMNVFDNTLLQAGGGREKLAQASTANQDVKGSLDAATQSIRDRIGRGDDPNTPEDESAGAIGQTNKAQSEAYSQIQNAMNAWKSGFTPKVSQAQQNLTGTQQRVANDLGNDQLGLDQETMDLFGLSEGQRVYGLNFSDYLNSVSPGDVNASNVASNEDYARYGALADLAGEQDLMLKPEDATKAGTAPKFAADKEKIKSDISKKEAAYVEAYNNKPSGISADMPGFSFVDASMNPAGLTPKQIEEWWIPTMKSGDLYSVAPQIQQAVASVEAQLKNIKSNLGYNNLIKKNS